MDKPKAKIKKRGKEIKETEKRIKREKIIFVTVFLILVAVALVLAIVLPKKKVSETVKTPFCGISTEGKCNSNTDCIVSGCSNQVCQSKQEARIITTCEFRECYNAEAYGLKCKCSNGKCKWA